MVMRQKLGGRSWNWKEVEIGNQNAVRIFMSSIEGELVHWRVIQKSERCSICIRLQGGGELAA